MSSSGALRKLPSIVLALGRRSIVDTQAASSNRFLYTGTSTLPNGDPRDRTRWRSNYLPAAASLIGIGAVATVTSTADAPTSAEAAPNPYARPGEAHPLPSKITLYQYEVCPYCCKVRAFLDYHKLPYTVIEVNPLTKSELKWSIYKKVPVVKLDEEVVVDSSAIMSRLATDVAAAHPAPLPPQPPPAAAAAPPAVISSPSPKRSSNWWPFGGSSNSLVTPSDNGNKEEIPAAAATEAAGAVACPSVEVLAEEVRWRKWLDEKFVKVLTANIYRNWDEALETFKYITEQTGWSWGAREVARWTGAVIMWRVGKGLPAKYDIEGDLRQALYAAANDFVDNALRGRRFAGGDTAPNLADLSVFGVLRAVQKTAAFRDLMEHSRLESWFVAMEEVVGDAARINPGPGVK